jgi:TIR domain
MEAEELPPMTSRGHLIFISYRGSDQNWATELVYARMTEAFGGGAVFKAGNSLRVGEEFPPVLIREAASCPVMLVCIGPGWLTATAPDGRRRLDSPGDWVRQEIAISLQAGNHVVPLLIGNHDEVAVPKPDQVPEPIRPMVYRQAWRLAPGGGLDATIPMLADRLAGLVSELAERRRARSTTPIARGTAMTQRNEVAGGGLLIGAQGASVCVDARASATAAEGTRGQGGTGRGARMSIEGELAALAGAAAVALVTAMGTSAWASVLGAVTGAFRRAGMKGQEKIGGRLDADASLVAAADDQAAERAALRPYWLLKLTELVNAAPECAHELAEFIRARNEAAGTHREQPAMTVGPQSAQADRGGIAQNIVAGGSVTTSHTIKNITNGPSITAGRDVSYSQGDVTIYRTAD